jgi:hypothetical protein
MILFFDKNTGTAMPKALEMMKPPFEVEYHQKYFAMDAPDDQWLPVVGMKQWTVIGHDKSFIDNQSELEAIKKYEIGCFFLWGANITKWEKLRIFFKAFDRIIAAESSTKKPFVYLIKKNGGLKAKKLP